MPRGLRHIEISKEDEVRFIEWASQGKHKELVKQSHFDDGFNALVWGKKYSGITIHELWEDGVLDGSVPLYTLLGFESPKEILPKDIVDFMKGEIFKGAMADQVERAYQDVVQRWTWWRRCLYYLRKIATA